MKRIWIMDDYPSMGWHDCRIHCVSIDPKEYCAYFKLDYILEWIKSGETVDGFKVVTCLLRFDNVFDFKVHLDMGDSLDLIIEDLNILDDEKVQNSGDLGKLCKIYLNCGEISFSTTGFNMTEINDSVISNKQDYR